MRAARTIALALVSMAVAVPVADAASIDSARKKPRKARLYPLRVSDARLVDRWGRTVILHGVNVVYKVPPYYPNESQGETTNFNSRDVSRLRQWGFNTVRYGITWEAIMPQRGQIDERYIDQVVRLVRLAERGGMSVLVDMHQDLYAEEFQGNGAPSWAVEDDGLRATYARTPFPTGYLHPAVGRSFHNFWIDKNGIRTQYVRAFAAVARRFRRDARVLGYDLINEPSCEVQRDPCGLPPQPRAANLWLLPFYRQIIPALRAADPRHPSFVEEWITNAYGYPYHLGDPPEGWPFPRHGLSHHVYCPALAEDQPLLEPQKPCPQHEEEALGHAQAMARRHRLASLVTEFGATDDLAILRRNLALFDRHAEGWQYWQYKTYFDPTTTAGGDPEEADAESIVDRFGRVKREKLRLLSRVYPSRIAGDQASWSFDPETRVFRFSYRPYRARRPRRRGGSRRPRRSRVTVVSVPRAVHYPNGFRVAVTGGRVASRRGRTPVRVVPRRRARRVAVTIRP